MIRTMRLPKNSAYPNYSETHLEDDWCVKAGCTPVCEEKKTDDETEPLRKGRAPAMIILTCQNCLIPILQQNVTRQHDGAIQIELTCTKCQAVYRVTVVILHEGKHVESDDSVIRSETYLPNGQRVAVKDYAQRLAEWQSGKDKAEDAFEAGSSNEVA